MTWNKLLRSMATVALVSTAFLAAKPAAAGPVSQCSFGTGLTCDLYDGWGQSGPVAFPPPAVETDGYLVALKQGGSFADPSTWADVLLFQDDGSGFASSVEIVSPNGAPGSIPDALALGSSVDLAYISSLLLAPASALNANGFVSFSFNGGFDQVNLTVPEPGAALLLSTALFGLGFVRRARR